MARRRVSLVDALLVLPWWVSVFVAVVVYAALSYGPLYFADHSFTAGIGMVARNVAPYAAAFFISIAFLRFLLTYHIRRKFSALESIDHIRQLSWRQFEAIVGEAFRRRGYRVGENAVDGPDGGIDLVLHKGRAKFYVQCKQWKRAKVGVKSIRELYGVMMAGGAAGGFFVVSGEYTKEARDFARHCGVELIDGARLAEMIATARDPTADIGSRSGSPRRWD